MHNVYQLKKAKILKLVRENDNTVTLKLRFDEQKSFKFLAGQFMQVGLPGFGECPISISSNPKESSKQFSLIIREAGELTRKLNQLKADDFVYARGPFGNGFPEVNRNLILIAGGCGFIPLRSVYEENKNRKDIKIQLLIGCATASGIVFRRELARIKEKHDLSLILEKETLPEFSDSKGLVTKLIKENELLADALVFICGPAAMHKSVIDELMKKNVASASIYVSFERRMHCGVGVCQHCAVGAKYVCRDGPVFGLEFLKANSLLN
ncbi:FAD/NAD(P)-binding protein [Candidatus Falkowbacteria bacterium]|nr:FAD/NAD(P)-binding protein [Candidatus Falkowbacteria bacterium]